MKLYKLCRKCGESKELDEFSNSRTQKDGKKSYCKQCDRLLEKERYNNKKSDRQKQIKKWNREHQDKMRIYKKNWIERQKLLKK